MVNVKFSIDPRAKSPAICVRFYMGRKIDCQRKTHFHIDSRFWNDEKQCVRNLTECINRDQINDYLRRLRDYLIDSFNYDYGHGAQIDGQWLQGKINVFNSRPEDEGNGNDTGVYFTDYAREYIDSLPFKVDKKTGKIGRTPRTISYYENLRNKVLEYESHHQTRVRIIDIDTKFEEKFIRYLKHVDGLNTNSIGKMIPSVKTIALDARSHGIQTAPGLDGIKGFSEPVPVIYLNNDELDAIYLLDLDPDGVMDNVRDWMITGAYIGQRVSDLLTLTERNIKDGTIQLTQLKTGQRVVIPIHPRVAKVLAKRDGCFPPRIGDQKLNEYVKEVCRKAGITEPTEGVKMNPKTRRKEHGTYPKYELISSHTLRRSFCTNHYGKLPNAVIMSISGHKGENVFLKYVGKTSEDHVHFVADFWKNENL